MFARVEHGGLPVIFLLHVWSRFYIKMPKHAVGIHIPEYTKGV